jgi:hypothetical protein
MLFGGKVEKILKSEKGERAIFNIHMLLQPIFELNPDKLSHPERTFSYIEELEDAVNCDGFQLFFYNEAGNHTHEIIEALKEVKSVEFLRITEAAVKLFPEGKVPKDRDERNNIQEKIEENPNAEQLWNELDNEFFKYDEDIHVLLLTYVKENIKEFR